MAEQVRCWRCDRKLDDLAGVECHELGVQPPKPSYQTSILIFIVLSTVILCGGLLLAWWINWP